MSPQPAYANPSIAPARYRVTRHSFHYREKGFTLTEVAMAIAVVAFAFVSLLALIPNSLETFRRAIDATITSQIAQRIVSEAQETDFEFLVDNTKNRAEAQTEEFSRLPVRYFDDQGNELASSAKSRAIYQTVLRLSQPGPLDQATSSDSKWFTSLPATGKRFKPRDMTILTLEIATIGSHPELPFDESTLLIDPVRAHEQRIAYQTYSAIIARNGYRRTTTQP